VVAQPILINPQIQQDGQRKAVHRVRGLADCQGIPWATNDEIKGAEQKKKDFMERVLTYLKKHSRRMENGLPMYDLS
jgi:hypothetical protein